MWMTRTATSCKFQPHPPKCHIKSVPSEYSHTLSSNAINGTNVYIIYAQTPLFSITGDSCTDPAPITATTCPAAPTVTVTVRGSSTSTSGPASATTFPQVKLAAAAAANSSVITTTTTATTPAAPVATAPINGVYPSVIGWNGTYSNPIVLNNVPRAGVEASSPTTAPVAAHTFGAGYGWNTTTLTRPAAAATAAPVKVAEKVVAAKGCSKKRSTRKRHSDGNSKLQARKAAMMPPRL